MIVWGSATTGASVGASGAVPCVGLGRSAVGAVPCVGLGRSTTGVGLASPQAERTNPNINTREIAILLFEDITNLLIGISN
jgi:hypothetical protein